MRELIKMRTSVSGCLAKYMISMATTNAHTEGLQIQMHFKQKLRKLQIVIWKEQKIKMTLLRKPRNFYVMAVAVPTELKVAPVPKNYKKKQCCLI